MQTWLEVNFFLVRSLCLGSPCLPSHTHTCPQHSTVALYQETNPGIIRLSNAIPRKQIPPSSMAAQIQGDGSACAARTLPQAQWPAGSWTVEHELQD